MSKRSLKKQLKKARTQKALSELYGNSRSRVESVKGEFHYKGSVVPRKNKNAKKAVNLALSQDSEASTHEILKSIVLASLILSLELVLYFVWK